MSRSGSGPGNKGQAVEITILPGYERVTGRPDETLPLGFASGFVVKRQART